MRIAKRGLALLLAAVMLFSFAACGSKEASGAVASCGSREISGGLYMRFLLDAYTLADNYKETEDDVLDSTVEGIPAREWIEKTARDDVGRYFACMEHFSETGLDVTDEDQAMIDNYAAQMLNQYGILFETNGIGLQSLKDYSEYNVKSMAIFDHYYAEGGVEEAPAEEVKAAMKDTFNLTKVMIFDKPITTVEADGSKKEPTAAELAAAEAKARGYYDRAAAGEDFEELIMEWKLDLFGEDYVKNEAPDARHDLITRIGDPEVPEAYAKVMDSAPYGEVQFIEDADVYYVAVRYDITENERTYAEYLPTVLLTIRSEDFRIKTDEWASQLDIKFNDSVLKKYSVDVLADNMKKVEQQLADK